MIITLRQFLNGGYHNLGIQGVYIFFDGEMPLYAGKSTHVSRRVAAHVGVNRPLPPRIYGSNGIFSPSEIGWLIRNLGAKSFEWKLETVRYPHSSGLSLEKLEKKIISEMNPCMNVEYRTTKRELPHYLKTLTREQYEFDEIQPDAQLGKRLDARVLKIIKRFSKIPVPEIT